MEYTSNLDTLEGFSNASARRCMHKVDAWATSYPMVKVGESQKLLMVVNKAPGSLYFDS